MVKRWNSRAPTREMLEEKRKLIKEQGELFELELEVEKEAIAFQELKLQWLEERVTLDDILRDDTWSLCKYISKLRGERANRSPFVETSEEEHVTEDANKRRPVR